MSLDKSSLDKTSLDEMSLDETMLDERTWNKSDISPNFPSPKEVLCM
jgi:hypothetical protein